MVEASTVPEHARAAHRDTGPHKGKRFLTGAAIIGGLWLLSWLIGSAWIRAREPERLGTQPDGVPGRLVAVGENRVHVVERGAGPAMLLIHGTGGSTALWPEAVLDAFARDHRVIAIDLYGWGFSERGSDFPYGFTFWSQQVYDTLQVLDVERVVVVGHSLGACVAVLFAADHPEMVSHVVVSGNGEMLAPGYFALLTPGIGEMVLATQAVPVQTFSETHRAYERAAYRIRGTRRALLVNARRTLFESKAFFAAYPKVTAPVLQIHGTEDEEIPLWAMRRTHDRFPAGRKHLVLIEGSRHFVMADRPHEYLEAIQTFLQTEPASALNPVGT